MKWTDLTNIELDQLLAFAKSLSDGEITAKMFVVFYKHLEKAVEERKKEGR